MGRKANGPDEFIDSFEVASNGCWEWGPGRARSTKGYGIFVVCSRPIQAHRYSYELFIGEIPGGFCVLHKCDNPPCVNPDHLWVGTQKQNQLDKLLKGRAAKKEKNGNSRLTEKEVIDIREMRGYSQRQLSLIFRVSQRTIHNILTEKQWKGV